jgi:hypothetical protein
MKRSILAIAFCMFIITGYAQVNTWNGSLDNDWHKSCNWSLNQIPACSHDVVIPNTSNKPRITGVAHSRTIDVQSAGGAHLYVETSLGAQLYVSSTNGGGCSGTPTNNSWACCSSGSAVLNYTGGMQTWQVPACVTTITYNVVGAKGGYGYPAYSRGGFGGQITGTLSVTPNETLYIFVGGQGGDAGSCNGGTGGYNGGAQGAVYCGSYGGGGGGGASDIRQGGAGYGNRVVVAGGGGGGGLNYFNTDYDRGGAGGAPNGECGYSGGGACSGGYPGYGGSQGGGGAAGFYSGYCGATAGGYGDGGAGGACANGGGGGGGGYFGGGGGVWAGGGGGSNYPAGGSQGVQNGSGYVTISW